MSAAVTAVSDSMETRFALMSVSRTSKQSVENYDKSERQLEYAVTFSPKCTVLVKVSVLDASVGGSVKDATIQDYSGDCGDGSQDVHASGDFGLLDQLNKIASIEKLSGGKEVTSASYNIGSTKWAILKLK